MGALVEELGVAGCGETGGLLEWRRVEDCLRVCDIDILVLQISCVQVSEVNVAVGGMTVW